MEGYKKKDIGEANASASTQGRKAFIGEKAKPQTLSSVMPDWRERVEKNFAVSLFFTPESEHQIQALVNRVSAIAEKNGLKLSRSGFDHPMHMTLQIGRYYNESGDVSKIDDEAAERVEIYKKMFESAEAQVGGSGLIGQKIELKYVLMRPDSIILTAVEIPPVVKSFREAIAESAKKYGIKNARSPDQDVVPNKNILHMTLGRFIEPLPDQENFNRMRKDFTLLRHEISAKPLYATVESMHYINPLASNFSRPTVEPKN